MTSHTRIAALFLLASACTGEATSFSFSQSATAVFPASPVATLPTTIPTTLPESTQIPEVADFGDLLNLDLGPAPIEEMGLLPEDISRIELKGLTVTVLQPDGGDLSFLDVLELWVSADGLDEVRLAGQDGFAAGASQITPDVTSENLKPWLFADGLSVRPVISGLPPAAETTVEVALDLEVGVSWDGLAQRLGQ